MSNIIWPSLFSIKKKQFTEIDYTDNNDLSDNDEHNNFRSKVNNKSNKRTIDMCHNFSDSITKKLKYTL